MSVCNGYVRSIVCNNNCAMYDSSVVHFFGIDGQQPPVADTELLIEEQGIELEAAKNPPYELYR